VGKPGRPPSPKFKPTPERLTCLLGNRPAKELAAEWGVGYQTVTLARKAARLTASVEKGAAPAREAGGKLPFSTFLSFLQWAGVSLSPAQTILAAVCFDGTPRIQLTDLGKKLYDQLFGIDEHGKPVVFPHRAIDWFVWVVGARSGKSYVLTLALLWKGLTADLSALAPGEQGYGIVVCPDMKLSRHALSYAAGLIASKLELDSLVKSQTKDQITLCRPDGKLITIEALPATRGGGAVRGRTLFAAALDEVAFFRDDSFAVNDQDIFDAVEPRVTIPNGFLVLSSTPWLESGLLHTMWRDNYTHPRTALCAHAPTQLMRSDSRVICDKVDQARMQNPKNAAREFDAQFGATSSGLFFDQTAVRGAMMRELSQIPVQQGARVWIAVDAAFSTDTSDLFGWAVCTSLVSGIIRDGDLRREKRVTTVHECGGWPVDRAPREMALRLRDEVCKRYGVTRITIDQYSDRTFAQLCRDVGLTADSIAWVGGDKDGSKNERYRRVRTSLANGSVVLCDSEQLRHDMAECRVFPLPGGGERITVPRTRRGHGDILSAVVMGASEAMGLPGALAPAVVAPEVEAEVERTAEERRLFREAQKRAKRSGRSNLSDRLSPFRRLSR